MLISRVCVLRAFLSDVISCAEPKVKRGKYYWLQYITDRMLKYRFMYYEEMSHLRILKCV